MSEQRLVQALVGSVGQVPPNATVIGLKQYTLDEQQNRAKRLLALVGDQEQRALDRGDWVAGNGYTTLRLPDGARALLYHASGAMKYSSGLAPFDALFDKVEDKEQLIKRVHEAARRYDIAQWAGDLGEIVFERLWQTKAQGTDPTGKTSDPVLCRVVGAFRHQVEGLPVLGAASVALKLTGAQGLDSLSVQVRASASETVAKPRILEPELGARQLTQQLNSLLSQSLDRLPEDTIESATMQFGYLDLGKRKTQRVLAPAYVAQITLRHALERQAYVLAVSATEQTYLPLCQCGLEAEPAQSRKPLRPGGLKPVLLP